MMFHVLDDELQLERIFSNLFQACVTVLACLFLIGVHMMALESTWYAIEIYSFQLLDLYGKRPIKSMNVSLLLWIIVQTESYV